MSDRILETVDDRNWRDFLASPVAVLTLAISNCPACAGWSEELENWIAVQEGWQDTRFGRITLDSTRVIDFKENNEWLDHVPGIPFTAVFVAGEPRTSMAGTGVQRLERRLEKVVSSLEECDAQAPVALSEEQRGAEAPTTTVR